MNATESFCHYTHMLYPELPRSETRHLFHVLSRSPDVAYIGVHIPRELASDPRLAVQWIQNNLTDQQQKRLQSIFPSDMQADAGWIILIFIVVILIWIMGGISVVFHKIKQILDGDD